MEREQIELGLKYLANEFGEERVSRAIRLVSSLRVEVPSWIFGAFGGGRFGDYKPPGYARTICEKLDDASFVHRLTGVTDRIAMHVLWDFSDDGMTYSSKSAEKVFIEAKNRGLSIGSISPTYFLKNSERGSLSSYDSEIRDKYIEQTVFAGTVAKDFGCNLVTVWLPDGSLYPGQVELRKANEHVSYSLEMAREKIDKDVKILIEYKVFEPGTYSTVLSDWGSAYLIAKQLGANNGVLIDLGHHHHGVNIEQIVARLIDDGMMCGFHFNTRYAADDDHAVEPNPEVARIFYELVSGGVVCNDDPQKNWDFMIDQASGRENRMHAVLHSIDSLQLSLAKAALVDRERLLKYQRDDEIILANRFFNNALINADVRPIVASSRLERNLPVDPIEAYVMSGYQEKIESHRLVHNE